jgi:hypothetical protein
MQHSAKMESFQAWPAVNESQTRHPFNLEVVTKHLTRTEQLFFKNRANCSRNSIRQEPSGHGIVNQIRSPLVRVSPPPLTVGRVNASGQSAGSSSVWIALAFSLLSMKKRITVGYFIEIRNESAYV